MSTITMTVKAIKPPADGKKRGILIGTDDTIIGVFAEKIGLFRNGYTYEIDCSETESNGHTYRNVKGAKEIEGPKPAAVQAAPASNGYNSYRETCAKDAERMYVCSLVNAFIRAGKIEPTADHVIKATLAMRTAWSRTFGETNTFLASEAGKAARG